MKLKRLVIQGFKSFKDRTTVHFDQGITGIVGPNGCGKSNIVDALFWVMGEQSAKHLRGNSMKDLIFAGSSKYSPGSFAEATLVLENTEGKHIHIGNKVASPTEISLTRKLYRNGETEYRINNEPCRLKDIQEVFMDTGAGAKSYSIIAQGEINRLVQAKPEERRAMIEEVAGITKFKLRKRESLRKIEQTQANLNRLNDLQQEIEKNLRALQKQAEKAERARSLKEKVRRNELVVNSHKVFDAMKNLRDGRIAVNEKTLELEGWRTRKDTLEVGLKNERIQKDERTARIEELQKEYNEVSRALATEEERINSLCNSVTEKEEQIETREKEIAELKEELENRSNRLKELEENKLLLEEESKQDFDFEAEEAKVEALKEELEEKNARVEEAREEIEGLKEEYAELDQRIFRNNSKLEEYASVLQDTTQEIEALEKQYSGLSGQLADERDASNSAKELEEKLIVESGKLKEEIDREMSELKKKEEELNEKTRELIQKESTLESLIEVNASLEGVNEGTSEFLAANEGGQYDLLGKLIQCEDQYSKGVQQLLNEYLDVLVSSADNLETLKDWMSGNAEKGIEILSTTSATPISEETIERLKLNGCQDLTRISDILDLPEEYAFGLKPFLEGYFLVSSLDEALFEQISTEIRFKAIATFDGKKVVRNVGGAKLLAVSGEKDIAQGIVERNNRINELRESLEVLRVKVEELETEVSNREEALSEKKENHEEMRNQLADAKADHAAKASALESKMANLKTGTARLDILKNRKNETSRLRLELLESEEGLDKKLSGLKDAIEGRDEMLSEVEESCSILRDNYSQAREEFLEKQVQAKSFGDRLNSIVSQIEDVNGQIERQKTRIDSNTELVAKYKTEIAAFEEDLTKLEESTQSTADELQKKEEVLNKFKDDLAILLQQMQEREDEVKKLTQDINKTEKEVVEIEGKQGHYIAEEEQITRDIFERYKIDLRKSIGTFLEYEESDYEALVDIQSMYWMETEDGPKDIKAEPYEFHRRYGQDLKECEQKFKSYRTELNRLGEINWQAIEDYDRQKLRYDFLREQEAELKQSLEDLEKAINHIDTKSRERFRAAFEEVNVRFEKVFPIIFGGGNAKLSVKGDVNDPECGVEIIAQPPGKKMQNINLMSGGEKALTAVSLIFSIFLVKPSPFCLLDEVDAPLDDANVGRFNELLREMSEESQFILITHNKKTMELNDTLYGVTMQEPGISKAVSVQLH